MPLYSHHTTRLTRSGSSVKTLCHYEPRVGGRFSGVLKVASAMLGQNINDHIHLIFPHDPLAARPISRPSKNGVPVGSLCSEIAHKNKWYYQPLKTKISSIPTNHRQGAGVVGFCAAFMIVFTSTFSLDSFYFNTFTSVCWMHKTLLCFRKQETLLCFREQETLLCFVHPANGSENVWDLASNTNRRDVTQHRWYNL